MKQAVVAAGLLLLASFQIYRRFDVVSEWSTISFWFFAELLRGNQFTQAMFLGGVTYAIGWVTQYLINTWYMPLRNNLMCEVTMRNSDPNFMAVVEYISDYLLINVR
jgi:hypothetical protein